MKCIVILRPQFTICPKIAGVVLVIVQHINGTFRILIFCQNAVVAEFHHLRGSHVVDILIHLTIAGGDASIGAVLLRILLRHLLVPTELHGVDGIGGRGGSAASTAKLVGQEGFGCLGIRERFEILLVLGCNCGIIRSVGISEYEMLLLRKQQRPVVEQCVRCACFGVCSRINQHHSPVNSASHSFNLPTRTSSLSIKSAM